MRIKNAREAFISKLVTHCYRLDFLTRSTMYSSMQFSEIRKYSIVLMKKVRGSRGKGGGATSFGNESRNKIDSIMISSNVVTINKFGHERGVFFREKL